MHKLYDFSYIGYTVEKRFDIHVIEITRECVVYRKPYTIF